MSIELTTSEIYDALFQAVGDGLRGQPDSIVEAWRMAKAEGLTVASRDGRAILQAWPSTAYDFIPVYEEILGVTVDPTLTTEQKQQALSVAYTQAIDAVLGSIAAQLAAIDPAFTVVEYPYEQAVTTETGVRAFEDWDPLDPLASGPAYGLATRSHTLWPNYSTDFILYAWLDTPGSLSVSDQRSLTAAAEQLNTILPAWVDFRVFKSAGFILDLDLLDVTVFADGVI